MSELEKNKQKKEDKVINALSDFVIRVSKGDANSIETAALPGVAYVLLNQIKKKPETAASPLEAMRNAFDFVAIDDKGDLQRGGEEECHFGQ